MSELGAGHYCYLIRSEAHRCNRTYIGFSTRPSNRLRQHNGDIKNGARKTARGRPWKHVIVVSGFPNKITALQFEWQWQKPHLSRVTKSALSTGVNKGSNVRRCSINHHCETLVVLLRSILWRQLNLTLYVMDDQSKDLVLKYLAPLRSTDIITSMTESKKIEQKNAAQTNQLYCINARSTSNAFLDECAGCFSRVTVGDRKYWRCIQCCSANHLICSAIGLTDRKAGNIIPTAYAANGDRNCSRLQFFTQRGETLVENETLRDTLPRPPSELRPISIRPGPNYSSESTSIAQQLALIPVSCSCPRCGKIYSWTDIVHSASILHTIHNRNRNPSSAAISSGSSTARSDSPIYSMKANKDLDTQQALFPDTEPFDLITRMNTDSDTRDGSDTDEGEGTDFDCDIGSGDDVDDDDDLVGKLPRLNLPKARLD